MKNDGNYAIFDKVAMGDYYDEFMAMDRVIGSGVVSGWTRQAKSRLSEKVIENICLYFERF